MVNSVTVDVEEYYHAANLAAVAPPGRWHSLPSRVESSTLTVLDIFDQSKAKGTFFVLGYVARRFPGLVKEIARRGHEVASHGYGHQFAYSQSPTQFFRDVRRTKILLEDQIGRQVAGYRAPNFSITAKNPWAYAELCRAGYRYDSSVHPIWHPRYANLDTSLTPYTIRTANGEIVEIPLAVRRERCFGVNWRIPVAGGAYWRLLPPPLIRFGLERIREREHRPACCYLHPWELDCEQPRLKGIGMLARLRHYGGTARFATRLQEYLCAFGSVPIAEMLQGYYPTVMQLPGEKVLK